MKKYLPSIIMFIICCGLVITVGVLADIGGHNRLCMALGAIAAALFIPTIISAMEAAGRIY